jgi:hypothetical protein
MSSAPVMARNKRRNNIIAILCVVLAASSSLIATKVREYSADRYIRLALRQQATAFGRQDIAGAIRPLADDLAVIYRDGTQTNLTYEAAMYAQIFESCTRIEASFTPTSIVLTNATAVVKQHNHIVVTLKKPVPGIGNRKVVDQDCITYWRHYGDGWRQFKMTY